MEDSYSEYLSKAQIDLIERTIGEKIKSINPIFMGFTDDTANLVTSSFSDRFSEDKRKLFYGDISLNISVLDFGVDSEARFSANFDFGKDNHKAVEVFAKLVTGDTVLYGHELFHFATNRLVNSLKINYEVNNSGLEFGYQLVGFEIEY